MRDLETLFLSHQCQKFCRVDIIFVDLDGPEGDSSAVVADYFIKAVRRMIN